MTKRPAEELQLLSDTVGQEDGNSQFALKMLLASVTLSVIVKYGELLLDAPFDAGRLSGAAALCIVVPTMLNIAKWAVRSSNPTSSFGKIF